MKTKFKILKPKRITSIILLTALLLGSAQEAEAKFIGWEETGVTFGPISSPNDLGQCVTYVQVQYYFCWIPVGDPQLREVYGYCY